MSKIDLISGNWSEIVFDGRNKAYGAYQIRQGTGKRNLWAMISVLGLGVLIFAILTLKNAIEEAAANSTNIAEVEMSDLYEEEVKEDEPEVERQTFDQPEQQEVVEQVASSTAFQVPEIKKDEEVHNEVSSVDEVQNSDKKIGDFNVEGNNEDAGVLKAKETIEQPKEEPKPEVEHKVFDVVEVMPSFNGNINQYLASNIKYPVIAQENGVQGRVVVTFVVERDGSITDVKVVKSVDPSLDKEAVRVASSMPKWIPGKQNGQPVRVKFTLPVTFKLQ